MKYLVVSKLFSYPRVEGIFDWQGLREYVEQRGLRYTEVYEVSRKLDLGLGIWDNG